MAILSNLIDVKDLGTIPIQTDNTQIPEIIQTQPSAPTTGSQLAAYLLSLASWVKDTAPRVVKAYRGGFRKIRADVYIPFLRDANRKENEVAIGQQDINIGTLFVFGVPQKYIDTYKRIYGVEDVFVFEGVTKEQLPTERNGKKLAAIGGIKWTDLFTGIPRQALIPIYTNKPLEKKKGGIFSSKWGAIGLAMISIPLIPIVLPKKKGKNE